jgi:hypothetical protein
MASTALIKPSGMPLKGFTVDCLKFNQKNDHSPRGQAGVLPVKGESGKSGRSTVPGQ